jgi:hypothetical protein
LIFEEDELTRSRSSRHEQSGAAARKSQQVDAISALGARTCSSHELQEPVNHLQVASFSISEDDELVIGQRTVHANDMQVE